MTFTTSEAGYDLIRRFEGCEKKRPDGLIESYKVGSDPQTIGWGQTGKMPDGRPVVAGLVISQQEADDALQFFVRNVVEPLVRKHFVCRTQNEFDACVSFVYNTNHSKLEAGQYSLPQLVNQKARDVEALITLWLKYVATPGFENGLYKRRLAEVLMFLGLPWNAPAVWGYIANAVYKKGGVVNPTDPWFILQVAERAAEALSPPPPPPPKPAPAAKPEAPAKPEPKVVAGQTKKPPSPNTKAPVEVGIDPGAGLKHISESERAHGWYIQRSSLLILRFATLGMFGTGAKGAAEYVQQDATLTAVLFDLWVPLALAGGTAAFAYGRYWWGKYKETEGRRKATQGLYV